MANVTNYYQISEDARVNIEKRLFELVNSRETTQQEMQRLQNAKDLLTRRIESQKLELVSLRVQLKKAQELVNNQQVQFNQTLLSEVKSRQELEAQIILAARREAKARSQVENLRAQINRTIPELQNAMRKLAQPPMEDASVSSE